MKHKIIKQISIGIFSLTIAFSAIPATIPTLFDIPSETQAAEIEPRADVIYWRFRTLDDGTVQKRRWNETKGYWVDPDWIDCN